MNEWLDRYVSEWRFVRPSTTGQELKLAGLPPGPRYGRILERLLVARLDGEVDDDAGEKALLEEMLGRELE